MLPIDQEARNLMRDADRLSKTKAVEVLFQNCKSQGEYQRLMNNKTAIKRVQFELAQGLPNVSSLSKSPKSKRK